MTDMVFLSFKSCIFMYIFYYFCIYVKVFANSLISNYAICSSIKMLLLHQFKSHLHFVFIATRNKYFLYICI